MKIKDVLVTINQMQADGVIDGYAIGGAVGATFFVEPISTIDIDIFVAFQPAPGRLLIDPQPLFDYLAERGWHARGEYVVIADWPVQFLPPPTPLVAEALAEALPFDVDGEPTRVCSPEHLACIALELGRPKDKLRLLQFVEAGRLDPARLNAILVRHRLVESWQRFEEQFLGDST